VLQVLEFLLVQRQLNLKFLHRVPEFVLLILVFFPDCRNEGFIFRAQGRLVILVFLLQHSDHVCVVHSHPLYQVLVVLLRPRLTLQRILHLLFQSAVVTV
jgi:hypothetical protein